jgi:putative membrane protein
MWGDWGNGCGGGHWLFPVLIVIVVIFVLRMVSHRWGWGGRWHGRWGHGHCGCGRGHGPWGHYHGGADSALEILRQRYARGEVNKEDYDRMRKDLEG